MMPKDHRSIRSQGCYRSSPVTTPTSATYAPIPSLPTTSSMQNTYYGAPMSSTVPQAYTNQSYSTGGPVQHPMSSTTYSSSLPNSLTTAPATSIRPSSGAWSPEDDQTLMAARAQGMNWAPIQQAYFPSKSANACRKRHERLVERRASDDWDGLKLQTLAKNYMGMRKEIWSGLAAQTGEKWSVVEQKCMSRGLKNLQQAARSYTRRERMLAANGLGTGGGYDPHHTDDSGIGIDDLDADYDADRASVKSAGSNSNHSMGGGAYVYQTHGQQGYQTQQHQRYQTHQSRYSGVDMGIDSIINPSGPR